MISFAVEFEKGATPAEWPERIQVPVSWNDLTVAQLERLQTPGLSRKEAYAIVMDIPLLMLEYLPGYFIRSLPETLQFLNDLEYLEILTDKSESAIKDKPAITRSALEIVEKQYFEELDRLLPGGRTELEKWQVLLSITSSICAAYTLSPESMISPFLNLEIIGKANWIKTQPVPAIWGPACQYVQLFAQDMRIKIMHKKARKANKLLLTLPTL